MEKNILFKANCLNKIFSGTVALEDVSLEIYEGEIIGLVGENGAGKSTLLNIIMGIYPKSSGIMTLNGNQYDPRNSKEANSLGIGMVFQEQSLITNLTVGQNIFLGNEKKFSKFGFINWRKMYREAKRALVEAGINELLPDKIIIDLNFAQRQLVEIAKILRLSKDNSKGKSLILLDESTSVLSNDEINKLFKEMKVLKEKGNSIIFVSHRLEEVLEISDRVYVLKDGKNIGDMNVCDINLDRLYKMMVGKSSSGEYYKVNKQVKPKEHIALSVENLEKKGKFKGITFNLYEGEILGLCGAIGSGKEELCEIISGDEKMSRGKIYINGKMVSFNSQYLALKKGIISLPKERRNEGTLGILSVCDNLNISSLDNLKSKGFLSKKKQINQCKEWIDKLNIKCSSYKEAIDSLSGGNAQKVLFARILSSGARILVLNHPTRGIDVGAKDEIYNLLRNITERGISVIIISDTLDECIGLSNRIIVLKDGIITAEINAAPKNKPDQVSIIKHMI